MWVKQETEWGKCKVWLDFPQLIGPELPFLKAWWHHPKKAKQPHIWITDKLCTLTLIRLLWWTTLRLLLYETVEKLDCFVIRLYQYLQIVILNWSGFTLNLQTFKNLAGHSRTEQSKVHLKAARADFCWQLLLCNFKMIKGNDSQCEVQWSRSRFMKCKQLFWPSSSRGTFSSDLFVCCLWLRKLGMSFPEMVNSAVWRGA